MAYDNTNSGALFVNDRKNQPNHPDFKGSADEILCPHCQQKTGFWLSAWKKVSKGGKQFLSVALSPKEEVSQVPANGQDAFDMGSPAPTASRESTAEMANSTPSGHPSYDDFDDDIPF